MVSTNLEIIAELKAFLELSSSDSEIRRLFTASDNNFSRNRKLPFVTLVSMLINLPKRSLSVEIQEFFDNIGSSELSCTKGAFCLQRVKLKPIFFKAWNKYLIDNFYERYGSKVRRWKGFNLLAVDGSTGYLFDKGDIRTHFGTQSNQYTQIPMARVMQIQDVLNELTLWSDLYPANESEQHIISSNLHHIPPGSLTLFDRGYPGYTLMYLLLNQEQPRQFVMRCRHNFNNAVKDFLKSGKHNKIIELNPDKRTIAQLREYGFIVTERTTIKVRIVKINLPGGGQEILLTSLYDERVYDLGQLKELYAMRWRLETAFYKQKNQQQMEIFTGHKVICIEQDYAAGIFVANLQSLIEKQTESYLQSISRKRKHLYKINKNVSWAALKHTAIKLFVDEDPFVILIHLQKAFERNIEPVRPHRTYPRLFRTNRSKGKYQTLTNYRRAL